MRVAHKRQLAFHLVGTLVGLGLLGFLVWNVGVAEVLAHLRRIGWQAPLILLPYIGIALCDTQAWACTIPPALRTPSLSLWRLLLARLAGEAINNLTPTASIGGEPVKVYFLRTHGVATEVGLTTVIVAKTTLTAAQIAFILTGVPFFLYHLGLVWEAWVVFGCLVILGYIFMVVVIRWQRQGLMGKVVRMLKRFFPKWQVLARWEESATHIDARLLSFYEHDTRTFVASTVYHFIGWVLGIAEVMFFFLLMDVPVTFVEALIIETMLQPVHAGAIAVPGALGVQEAGGVFLCRLLGIDDGAGLTLMTLRRAREAVYNLIGLAVLVRMRRRGSSLAVE